MSGGVAYSPDSLVMGHICMDDYIPRRRYEELQYTSTSSDANIQITIKNEGQPESHPSPVLLYLAFICLTMPKIE